jgi:hypothetical protein
MQSAGDSSSGSAAVKYGRAKAPFATLMDWQISFERGDIIEILDQDSKEW